MSEKILRLAESVAPENMVTIGICFGKFTKSNKFLLHITALTYLAPYAQVSQSWLTYFGISQYSTVRMLKTVNTFAELEIV